MLDRLDKLPQQQPQTPNPKHQTPNNKHQTPNKHFEQIEPLKPFEQNHLKTQRPFQETLR